jgi:hypothetical protein
MEHPPKPRLTLRVGIVGHRPDKLGTDTGRIEEQLKKVFDAITTSADAILTAGKDCYALEPPVIRLVSGFAEGADRMAVRLCPDGWQIEAILPFPKNTYVATFSGNGVAADAESSFAEILKKANVITELSHPLDRVDAHRSHADQEARHREQGYVDAGGYFLRQIDLLIAIWDGNPPKVAGTGAIARHAFEGGIPVVWITTRDQDRPPRLIQGFDKHTISATPDATDGPLEKVLKAIFGAPSEVGRDSRKPAGLGLRDFYREDWRERCRLPFYDLLKRYASRQKLRHVIPIDSLATRTDEWDKFIVGAPHADNLAGRIRTILLPRFVWADSLAIYFSHYYRSAYVLAYSLSALAVFIALGGLFANSVDGKAAFVLCELLVIATIIETIRRGRRRRWHERWLDYRALAESLRYGRLLSFVSEFGHVRERSSESTSEPWAFWYLRATMREVGLPTALINSSYQWRVLDTTLTHEINEQYEYHESNSKNMHNIDHMLHRLGVICFSATAGILAVFFLGYVVEFAMTHMGAKTTPLDAPLNYLESAMIFFSAGLPAFGAALAGIRVHGDFEGSKQRSDKMLEVLAALKDDYKAATNHEISLDETAELLLTATRAMSEDVSAWQELYGRKRLMLPA